MATYFAVMEYENQPGALWALSPVRLNETYGHGRAILLPRNPAASALIRLAFTEPSAAADQILALYPAETDLRMLIQQGRVTIHGSATPLEEGPNLGGHVRKFLIPPSAKPHLKSQLRGLGLTCATLFPDLEHLAKELNDRKFAPGR